MESTRTPKFLQPEKCRIQSSNYSELEVPNNKNTIVFRKRAKKIFLCFKEFSERGTVIEQLVYCIKSYREAAVSNDPKFEHIDLAEKQKVLNECVEAEAWLRERKQHQDALPKYATPILLSADVRKKAEALDRFCRPIMTKPKPPTGGEPMETEKPE